MAGETIRDVTIRISIKTGGGDEIKLPNLKPAEVAAKAVGKALEDVAKKSETVKSAASKAADELERLKKIDEKKLQGLEAADKFKATGEAAFTMARGAAFLFTSTDDGFAQMAANIAKVQGGFDLFKGSFDTVKNLSEGLIKLKAVTGATTVATALQTAASYGLSTALGVTRVAALALYTALGPLGVAAAAVAAISATIYAGWKWFAGPEPAKNIDRTTSALAKMHAEQTKLAKGVAEARARRQGAVEDAGAERDRNAASADKETKLLEQQAKVMGTELNIESRMATLRKQAEQDRAKAVMAATEMANMAGTTAIEEQALAEIDRARLEFSERMAALAEQELDTTRARGDELGRQKTEQENLLKTTNERIKAEKDALLSAEAKFGQLSKREQQRVKDIAAAGGPKTAKEAEVVQKAGFDSAATGFFAKRGREAGFEQASKALGGKTDEDLKKLEKERGEIENRLAQVRDKITANQSRQLNLLDQVVSELEKVDANANRMAEIERKLQIRKAREDARRT